MRGFGLLLKMLKHFEDMLNIFEFSNVKLVPASFSDSLELL